ARVSILHALDDEQLIKLQHRLIVAPAHMPDALAQVLKAACELKKEALPPGLSPALSRVQVSPQARGIAESMAAGRGPAVLLGNLAQHHPQASLLHRLGLALAQVCGAKFGFLGEAANSVGGYVAEAVPFPAPTGLNAAQMLAQPLHAYLLLNAEVDLDAHDPYRAIAAMRGASFVVALSSFRHRALEYAHALLPIAPFTETAGSFINTDGQLQTFNAVVRPL